MCNCGCNSCSKCNAGKEGKTYNGEKMGQKQGQSHQGGQGQKQGQQSGQGQKQSDGQGQKPEKK